jgi:phosphate starvation-inducible protein PhoH
MGRALIKRQRLPFLKGRHMKSTVGRRKAAESVRGLRDAQKELKRQDVESHVRDTHKLDRGDSHGKIRVVGGDENKNSHSTEYQKKMLRGETATNAGKMKTRTLMQKEISKNSALFD